MDRAQRMGKMAILPLLITMSIPAVISMMVEAAYNIVDSIFVGQISENALIAVSLAFPLQMILVSVTVGLGIGISVVVSRKLGENNEEDAVNAGVHGFVIAFFMWLVVVAVGLVVPKMFFGLFTDDVDVINQGVTYISIIMIFSFGRIMARVCASFLQANGDMISSMKIQITGAVINIIMDPILIFGFLLIPGLGIAGAAIATSGAQVVGMFVGLYLLRRNRLGAKISLRNFKFDKKIAIPMTLIGLPAMIMQGLSSIMILALNSIISGITLVGVAVLGVYYKLQMVVLMPIFGMCQGLMPIIGYNFGAKEKDRIKEVYKYSLIIAISIMVFGLILFQLIPKQLLLLFNAETEMLGLGVTAFRILSLGFVFAGFSIVTSTVFQSTGKAYLSLIMSLLRQIILLLPLASILSKRIGINGVWYSLPIVEAFSVIIAAVLITYLFKNTIMKLEKVDEDVITSLL